MIANDVVVAVASSWLCAAHHDDDDDDFLSKSLANQKNSRRRLMRITGLRLDEWPEVTRTTKSGPRPEAAEASRQASN